MPISSSVPESSELEDLWRHFSASIVLINELSTLWSQEKSFFFFFLSLFYDASQKVKSESWWTRFWHGLKAWSREGNGTPLQYSCLENPMDGYSPWGRQESETTERLHFHFSLSCIGEGNGNPLQCSCLENSRDGEPGGLPSMGSHRVGHNWSDLAAAALLDFNCNN